jgi:hypothetical protein
MSGPDLTSLDRDGWIALPGLLTPTQAAEVAHLCLAVLDDPGDLRQGDKRAGGTVHAAELVQRVAAIGDLLGQADLRRAVDALLGPGVELPDVGLRCPQPGFGEQTLHADDTPTERADQCRAATAIVALCDFTAENGATAVVPGSHRRPDLQRRARRVDLSGAEVRLTGPAGTAFVFSAHLLHRGTRNRSDRPRPALQAQWRLTRGRWP